jgi:hypothetical protein
MFGIQAGHSRWVSVLHLTTTACGGLTIWNLVIELLRSLAGGDDMTKLAHQNPTYPDFTINQKSLGTKSTFAS